MTLVDAAIATAPMEAALVYAFDTLGYAKRLRDAGVPQPQAEAHAEAAREFIMTELITKTDLQVIRTDFQAFKTDLQVTKTELQAASTALEGRLESRIENLSLRLTVRLGAMLAVAVGALAAMLKLT
jgi:hypothetical protein